MEVSRLNAILIPVPYNTEERSPRRLFFHFLKHYQWGVGVSSRGGVLTVPMTAR